MRTSAASSEPTPGRGPERLARCLIIGCGCRGGELARALLARGHSVRGTTRNNAHRGAIEAAGAEAIVADPDRIATLMPAIEGVAIVCVLLGSARGERQKMEALHGTRLEMLIARLIDSTVRGIVYEASGALPAAVLAEGAQRARRACQRSRLPFALLDDSPDDREIWLASALRAVERVLGLQTA